MADKQAEVEAALAGDEDTQEIPQEVLDAVKGIDTSQLAVNRTKPTPAVLEAHEENLKEAEKMEARPNVVEPKAGITSDEFVCYRDKTFGMWHIKRADKGKVPAHLSGSYTELRMANLAINDHVVKSNSKVA